MVPARVWLEALDRYAAGEPTRSIAESLGINANTLRRRASEDGIKHGSSPEVVVRKRKCRAADCDEYFIPVNASHWYHEPACRQADEKLSVAEVFSLEAGVEGDYQDFAKGAFAQKNRVLRALSGARSLRDYLGNEVRSYLDEHPEERLRPTHRPSAGGTGKSDRAIILMLSDWQVGKLENGIGVQEMEERRIPRILDAYQSIVRHFRDSGYPVRSTHIAFIGDMIEGCHIYRGQNVTGLDRHDNTHRLTRQIMKASHLQAHVVRAAMETTPDVEVHGVRGNHGRTSTRSEFSDPEDNFDTMSLEWARDLVSGDVHWDIETSTWWQTFKVFNHTFAMAHGDQWNGPLWRIETLLPQWVTGNVFGTRDVDALLLGHRHDFVSMRVNGIHVVQNGTIDGGSNWYQQAYGRNSPPEQTVLVVSPQRSVEAIYPVYF